MLDNLTGAKIHRFIEENKPDDKLVEDIQRTNPDIWPSGYKYLIHLDKAGGVARGLRLNLSYSCRYTYKYFHAAWEHSEGYVLIASNLRYQRYGRRYKHGYRYIPYNRDTKEVSFSTEIEKRELISCPTVMTNRWHILVKELTYDHIVEEIHKLMMANLS